MNEIFTWSCIIIVGTIVGGYLYYNLYHKVNLPSTPLDTISSHEALSEINATLIAKGHEIPEKANDNNSLEHLKGVFAKLFYNLELYNKGNRQEAQKHLEETIPILVACGMFDLFPADEWIASVSEAKKFIGIKAKDYMEMTSPEYMDAQKSVTRQEIKEELLDLT